MGIRNSGKDTSPPEIVERTRFGVTPAFAAIPQSFIGKIPVGATTISVKNVEHWIAQNTGAVTITTMDDGQEGQSLHILGDGNTTLQSNAGISLLSGADTLLASGQVYQFKRLNNIWYQSAAYTAPSSIALDNLSDVVLTAPASPEVLKYNGTNWVNAAVGYSELTGLPTTIAGYGITDAYTKSEVDTLLAALTTHDLTDWPADAAGVLTNDGAGGYSWGAGGGVSSVFGRTGAVVATLGDYDASLISAGTFPVGTFVIPATGQLNVNADATKTVPLRLVGYAASSAFAAALGWYDSGGTVYGFVGKGSGSDSDSYMRASISGSGLQFWATSGAIDFRVNNNFTIRDGAGTAILAIFKDATQGVVLKAQYAPSYSFAIQDTGGTARLLLDETSSRWQMNWPISWSPDNTYDVGVSTSAGRPRTIYVGTSIVVGGAGTGTINLQSGYQFAGTKVVGARRTGWTAATGTATRTGFATSTVTLSQLAERVKALMDDLITHGLIGA